MEPEKIQLDFWNVGQGDASTITWPNERLTVIDCGPRKNPMIDFLTQKRPHINNIFITHNDEDHIGGLYSLVRYNHSNIDSVKMVDDRAPSCFKKIIGEIAKYSPQFVQDKIFRLECQSNQPSPLVKYKDYTVEICYPNFIANVQSSSPNATSAILRLKYKNEVIVVWGSDNSLTTIAATNSCAIPMLFGPHHGAPAEMDEAQLMDGLLQRISPSQCFLSFSTVNNYKHPNKNYIIALRKTGCTITCSQLAKKCAPGRTTPVFNGDALYGRKSPVKKNQVSCHGHTQFHVQGRNIYDEYATQYCEEVKKLSKALCNKA
ncbi:MAG: MBL fold metallo-hydrolase [Lentisphaeria bacterium]|jgi:beta-lactamase superfamily II metal-dependent hydrolase